MRKITILLLILSCSICQAKLWLPSILSDNMVLQRESEAMIWGWSTDTYSNEVVTVTGSWNGESVSGKSMLGAWSVKLPTPTPKREVLIQSL